METDRVDGSGVTFLVEDLHTALQVPQSPGVVKPAETLVIGRDEREGDTLTKLLLGTFLTDGRQYVRCGGRGLLALPLVCHWGGMS